MKSFKNFLEKVQKEDVELDEAITMSERGVLKAIQIAKEMGGNMTGAVRKIEKMKKGLSDHPKVQAALRLANESVKEEVEQVQEALPDHLKKILDKKGNIDPRKVPRAKKSSAKVTDVTPKGYGPKEEVELDEDTTMQLMRKLLLAPKMKKMVRFYLDWRRDNPGKGNMGVQKVIQMMGLNPRDGNQLIDTLNDLIKQGKLPKHLALNPGGLKEEQWGSDNPYKKYKNDPDRLKRILKKHQEAEGSMRNRIRKFVGSAPSGLKDELRDIEKRIKQIQDVMRESVELDELSPVTKIKAAIARGVRGPSKKATPAWARETGKAAKELKKKAAHAAEYEKKKKAVQQKRIRGEEVELEEKLKVSDGLGAWISDFQDSDAPQFKNADSKKRRDMAIAAFTAAGGKLEGTFWGSLLDAMNEGSETWEAGYERRVVKTTKPEHKEKGYNWRIKGKDRPEISIKLYKEKPSQAEFNKQMKRVAGHEFGG